MPDATLAYIDPGSGSLIIQVLIAALVAVPIFFRRQIARIVTVVRGRRDPVDKSEAADGPEVGADRR